MREGKLFGAAVLALMVAVAMPDRSRAQAGPEAGPPVGVELDLALTASVVNLHLPTQVSSRVLWTHVEAQGRTMTYHYKIHRAYKMKDGSRGRLRANAVRRLCTQERALHLMSNGAEMGFVYKHAGAAWRHAFVITYADCAGS